MMDNPIIEYRIGLSPRRLTISPIWLHTSKYKSIAQIQNEENLKNKQAREQMSRKTAMLIQRGVEWLSLSSYTKFVYSKIDNKTYNFKLGMITLTIPLCHRKPTSKEAYSQLLYPFLKSLKKYHGLQSYVWVREYQQNGMVHYHIITTEFIHKFTVQKLWNKLLFKASLLEDYYSRHKNYNPPSTNVQAVRNAELSAHYAAKYMSKKSQSATNDMGRRFGMSSNISTALKAKFFAQPDDMPTLSNTIIQNTSFYTNHYNNETYYLDHKFNYSQSHPLLKKEFTKIILQIRENGIKNIFAATAQTTSTPPTPTAQKQGTAPIFPSVKWQQSLLFSQAI
jgi:hypothetical protein